MPLKAAIVPVTPFQQNCTLLFDEATRRGVVVDPGGDRAAIEDAIGQIGMTVEEILLTHGHLDHAGAADELKAALGVKITGPHEADRFLLEGIEGQARAYGLLGLKNAHPDRWLVEGDTVTVAGVVFDVLHCPGHSPGSVVFVSKSERVALVGDVLFQGSIGRTDFPYGDTEALITSVRTKLFPLGDDIVFICGHGSASTFGDERRTNPFVGEGA
ncbi:MAG: MBL fold metallo-hydrolase [Gammaproteobacteria bacterium]|nr:MBL fold metallo-hydrolase [Gammaproteobacteria bacterium]